MPIEPGNRGRVGITINDLDKLYGRLQVLNGISLRIDPGRFVALLGPSGCGKTTLLRTIAGLEQPNRGTIDIGDRRVVDVAAGIVVPPQQRRLGMVFQHYALWPHMTVRENIGYPLRKQGFPRREWEPRIKAIAEAVGLPTILDRRPSQLSGGQQQRVALARALVSQPSVLLLDEPLSNLDANLRDQLRRELRQLHDRQGTTSVLVTHDQEEAAMVADIIVVIEHGVVVQVGRPDDILDRPGNRFVASFVGYDNFIPGVIEQTDGSAAHVRLTGGDVVRLRHNGSDLQIGRTAAVAVRSARIVLASKSEPGEGSFVELSGRVTRIQGLGRWRETYVDYAGTILTARDLAGSPSPAEPEDSVFVRIPSDSPVFVS
jgi:ABC-type Fe3+/spermidine/putrescine transport system ATPase subunit